MDKHLQDLKDARDVAARELDIHDLKGKALQKKYDAAVLLLQEACPHEDQHHEETYFSGGYDYCASTSHRIYCKTCGYLVDSYDETHHGRYG